MVDFTQGFIQLPPGGGQGPQPPHNAGPLHPQANTKPAPRPVPGPVAGPVAGPVTRQSVPQQIPQQLSQARSTAQQSQIRPQVQTEGALARHPTTITRPPQPPSSMIPPDWYDEDALEVLDVEEGDPLKMEERLSSYKVIRLEKMPTEDSQYDPAESQNFSWKRVLFVPVNDASQRDIINRIRELDMRTSGVMEKKEKLSPVAKRQLEKAAANLNQRDPDLRYQHVLVQFDDLMREIPQDEYQRPQYPKEHKKKSSHTSRARTRSRDRRTIPQDDDQQPQYSKEHKKKSSHTSRARSQSRGKPKKAYERIGVTCYFCRCPRPGQNLYALLEELDGVRSQGYPFQPYATPARSAVPPSPSAAQMKHHAVPHDQQHVARPQHSGPAGPLPGARLPGGLQAGDGPQRPQMDGGQPAGNAPRPQQAPTQQDQQLPPWKRLPPARTQQDQRQVPPAPMQQDQRHPGQLVQHTQVQMQYPQGPTQRGPQNQVQQNPQGQLSDRGVLQLSRAQQDQHHQRQLLEGTQEQLSDRGVIQPNKPQQAQHHQYQPHNAHQGQLSDRGVIQLNRPQQGQHHQQQHQHQDLHHGQPVHTRQFVQQRQESPDQAIDMRRNHSNSGFSEQESILSVSSCESGSDGTAITSLDSPRPRERRVSTIRYAGDGRPFDIATTRHRRESEHEVMDLSAAEARIMPQTFQSLTYEEFDMIKDQEYRRGQEDMLNVIQQQQMEGQVGMLEHGVRGNRELLRRTHLPQEEQDELRLQRRESLPIGLQRVVPPQEEQGELSFQRRESLPVGMQRVVRAEQRLPEDDKPRYSRRGSMPVNVIQRQGMGGVRYGSGGFRGDSDEDDSPSRGVTSMTISGRQQHRGGYSDERLAQERVHRQGDNTKYYTTSQPREIPRSDSSGSRDDFIREPRVFKDRRGLSKEPTRAVSQERRSKYYAEPPVRARNIPTSGR